MSIGRIAEFAYFLLVRPSIKFDMQVKLSLCIDRSLILQMRSFTVNQQVVQRECFQKFTASWKNLTPSIRQKNYTCSCDANVRTIDETIAISDSQPVHCVLQGRLVLQFHTIQACAYEQRGMFERLIKIRLAVHFEASRDGLYSAYCVCQKCASFTLVAIGVLFRYDFSAFVVILAAAA